ncbi:sensor histidine kinase [Parenemella sanctibonifatiensis]|nr:sensor histidine kinase [Parenemella sanctibonifatiensis]
MRTMTADASQEHAAVGSRLRGWLRTGVRGGLPIYLACLPFLGFGYAALWSEPALPRVFGFALLTGFGLCYVAASFSGPWSLRTRLAYAGTITALFLLLTPQLGAAVVSFNPFFSIALAATLPWRISRFAIAPIGLICLAVAYFSNNPTGLVLNLMAVMMAYSVVMWGHNAEVADELRSVRAENALLAVAAERERIGRDLHDLLGHSLTAVAVKAGLARRLAQQDPAAAEREMAEVESLARDALIDVRATVTGMREVRLPHELTTARAVLEAADVAVTISPTVPDLTEERSELLGWAVREAVTNVVRHADARHCSIEVTDTGVRIRDDGQGIRAAPGNGLRGLRERLETAGGSLSLTPGSADARRPGTLVEASVMT